MRRFDNSLLDLVQQRSTLQLFRNLDWHYPVERRLLLARRVDRRARPHRGRPPGICPDLHGFASAVYFSFVTATSIGYGDIVPLGGARVIAVAEAIIALLIFGAVVAKFVSHRQEELVSEIHRVTFEERLDRVETNLHTVISEILAITAMCEAKAPLNRVSIRLESAVILFLASCAPPAISSISRGWSSRKASWPRFSPPSPRR